MSSSSELSFDFNYLMADSLDSDEGLTTLEIESVFPSAKNIQDGFRDLRKLGQLPFQDLPYQADELKELQAKALSAFEKFDTIVVLGIGGSALGPMCLHEVINPQKKFYCFDNVDPECFLRHSIEPKRTLFIVTSKSGQTLETLAAFAYFRGQLMEHVGSNYKEHLVFITDPENGILRKLATEEDITCFEVPPGVGGRYSVLSPVGLLPAACLGIDIQAILAGARAMDERAQSGDYWLNPPFLSAITLFLFIQARQKALRVLMPYSESLELFAEWQAQLWAESLGKAQDLKGQTIHAGSTPLRAMGATDQHSQLQLYLDGPRDKVVSFYTVRERPPLSIPPTFQDIPELAHLAGKTFGELLDIEYKATEQALRQKGIPSLTIQLPRLDETSLGQLFYFCELEAAITGELHNINPFDQPAVEQIKKYIKGLLNISGFEEARKEIESAPKDKRYII